MNTPMIPLSYFLIAWAVLLAVFGFMTLLTLIQMLRHGLPSMSTYASTFLFLIVAAGVVIGTALYLFQADMSVSINLVPTSLLPIFPDGTQ